MSKLAYHFQRSRVSFTSRISTINKTGSDAITKEMKSVKKLQFSQLDFATSVRLKHYSAQWIYW